MIKVFSVDRVEGDILVCIDDDRNVYEFKRSVIGDLHEKDVFSADYQNDGIHNVTLLPEEKEERIKRAEERLKRLFGNSN